MQKVKNYVRESFAELQKVTWPTTEELKGSSYVVVVFFNSYVCFCLGCRLFAYKII
jgi:preprotein translocase subunit SecE